MFNFSHLFDGMQPSVLQHQENNPNGIIRMQKKESCLTAVKIYQ